MSSEFIHTKVKKSSWHTVGVIKKKKNPSYVLKYNSGMWIFYFPDEEQRLGMLWRHFRTSQVNARAGLLT